LIHILGAGAMGCLWAAALSRSHTLGFVSQRASDTRMITFTLEKRFLPASQNSTNYEFVQHLPSTTTETIERLLICTKSYAALPALESLRSQINQTTQLVLFQNGLGSQYQILAQFPDNPIFAAVTTEGVNRVSPSKVVHAGMGQTLLGALNPPAQEEATRRQCYQSLARSELQVQMSDDIGFALWKKLAINCAVNPFTAIHNCANGELLELPLFAATWPKLRRELCRLLESADYPIPEMELDAMVFEVINNTRHNISSMLQDIRRHKKTEIDDINGFAWRYLKAKQLDHEINLQLWEQVNALGT